MKVGILHPGAMGAALAGAASPEVHWASEGRSASTRERAEAHGLRDIGTVAELVGTCQVLVSVVPPDAARDVAMQVAGLGYTGVYVDANAIAPSHTIEIGEVFERTVDGGIIGPPPVAAGTTRIYLSGAEAQQVADLWRGGRLEPCVLGRDVGLASALKLAYAGWTKGSAALLLTMRAYAEAHGLGGDLEAEWHRSIPGLDDRARRTATNVGHKAWRFAGEMRQISSALEAMGLSAAFHTAAAETYTVLSDLKGADAVELQQVIELLLAGRSVSAE